MSYFAHYYIRFAKEFAPYEWENRQDHLSSLFETNESITFTSDENGEQKVYKHQVYHLNCAPKIIVMRLANNIDIPIELDFKPDSAKDEPSCFVIIDNRDRMRTVAIQKRSKTRWTPDNVAKILTNNIAPILFRNYCYQFGILPEYYPEDLYKAWELLQQHTAALRFSTPDKSIAEIRALINELKAKKPQYFDDSLIEPLLQIAIEARKAKYKHFYTVMPEDRKAPLYVDKTSRFVRNLVTMSEAVGEPVELVTTDGAAFRCFVDSDADNTSKIVHREFDTRLLELLFDERDKDGNKIEPEDRITAEAKILEMMNSMKHVVRDEEEESAA